MVAIFAIISVSFLERLRELGSLRAIGTTRAELLSLLLVEALATYLVGAAAALGLGLAAGTIINALGITFVPIGSNLAVPFYIDLETRYFLIPAAITLLMTAAAALVPVVRTARMSVAHVLRHEYPVPRLRWQHRRRSSSTAHTRKGTRESRKYHDGLLPSAGQ